MRRDTTSAGLAGVHIVCADIFLSGAKATLASEGLHYNVVADVGGNLIRIQVKSCLKPVVRPDRPSAPACYHFLTERGRRPASHSSPARITKYTEAEVDLIACVALDSRIAAYFPVVGTFGAGMNLYVPGAPSWERDGLGQRRRIDEFPFAAALAAIALSSRNSHNRESEK